MKSFNKQNQLFHTITEIQAIPFCSFGHGYVLALIKEDLEWYGVIFNDIFLSKRMLRYIVTYVTHSQTSNTKLRMLYHAFVSTVMISHNRVVFWLCFYLYEIVLSQVKSDVKCKSAITSDQFESRSDNGKMTIFYVFF